MPSDGKSSHGLWPGKIKRGECNNYEHSYKDNISMPIFFPKTVKVISQHMLAMDASVCTFLFTTNERIVRFL